MRKFLFGTALALLTAGAADATVYTQTYTGTVRSGLDTGNLFGGGNLAGQAFTAIYVFDDSIGQTQINNGVEHSARGGSVYSSATPNLATSLTINGLTYSFIGLSYGEIYADHESGFSYLSSLSRDDSIGAYLNNGVYDFSSQAYADPAFAFSGSVASALSNFGKFTLGTETVNLTNLTYTIAANATADVPEPASWAMFIGGFGLIGAALRARKSSIRFA